MAGHVPAPASKKGQAEAWGTQGLISVGASSSHTPSASGWELVGQVCSAYVLALLMAVWP